jgi:uncharacterized membrane protein YhiD involved in acid resistance
MEPMTWLLKLVPSKVIFAVFGAVALWAAKILNDKYQQKVGRDAYKDKQTKKQIVKLQRVKNISDSVDAMSDDDVERELRKYRTGIDK